jgi:transposase-like protein
MNSIKKYCPHCLKECEVESLGIILPIGLVDGSTIYEYRCKECCRIFRERRYKKIIE